MKILVVGAGAIGGYFGGRLLEAGGDVTFLLRPRRAAQIDAAGLVIKSSFGDITLRSPAHVAAGHIAVHFDLVIVACKAYDLAETMESFAPAVGETTCILPLLNGMQHIDALSARFGARHVLGGHCMISAALDPAGAIVHLNNLHSITFGELGGETTPRIAAIRAAFSRAKFDNQASGEIVQEMWEKWAFIASVGCINSLMRAAIGDIAAAGASSLATSMYDECRAIAAHNGHAPREPSVTRTIASLTAAGSLITASLLKDIERGGPTEAEHIVGDLIRRGGAGQHAQSLLSIAYAHLRSYEVRRARESLSLRNNMATLSSFDVTTGVDLQEVDNALNQAQKEIAQRYDFKGTNASAEFKKAESLIALHADSEYKMTALLDIVQSKLIRRGVPVKNLDIGESKPAGGDTVRRDVKLKMALDSETAKKVAAAIKEAKLKKVQASIQGEQVRVSAPSKDDLQEAMALLRAQDFGVELKFGNYR